MDTISNINFINNPKYYCSICHKEYSRKNSWARKERALSNTVDSQIEKGIIHCKKYPDIYGNSFLDDKR